MRAIGWLFRVLAYLYHLGLSLLLLALASVAILSGAQNLNLEMTPWHGSQLNQWLVGLGVAGLLIVCLAMIGRLRLLFPIWALFVLVMLVRGLFLSSSFTFSGPEQFNNGLWLTAGALVAFIGSLTLLGARRKP